MWVLCVLLARLIRELRVRLRTQSFALAWGQGSGERNVCKPARRRPRVYQRVSPTRRGELAITANSDAVVGDVSGVGWGWGSNGWTGAQRGWRPLHVAANMSNVALADILLESGAAPDAVHTVCLFLLLAAQWRYCCGLTIRL